MKSVLKRTTLATVILISGQFIACGGSDNSNTGGAAGTTGGSPSTAGTSAAAGTHATGGGKTTGGANSTGGSLSNGGSGTTGGSKSTGGATSASATGGTSAATGGKSSVAGSSAAGGNSATGGSTTAGGNSATGGNTTAGGSSATGGSAAVAGSSATGGSTTAGGASSTGGSTTAGGASGTVGGTTTAGGAGGGVTATGGMTATGGTTALLPEAAVLSANSPACLSCAQSSCASYLDNAAIDTANGYGSCQTVTGAANGANFDQVNEPWAATTWAGDPTPFTAAEAAAGGVAVTPFQLCMDLLTCLMQSKCDQGVLSACFCGDAVGTDCINSNNTPGGCADPTNPTTTKGCAKASTGPVNGNCAAEEENALDTNSFSTIPTAFADVTLPGGPANQLVNCLANKCAMQCSLSN